MGSPRVKRFEDEANDLREPEVNKWRQIIETNRRLSQRRPGFLDCR
jgi:hypothetical protein